MIKSFEKSCTHVRFMYKRALGECSLNTRILLEMTLICNIIMVSCGSSEDSQVVPGYIEDVIENNSIPLFSFQLYDKPSPYRLLMAGLLHNAMEGDACEFYGKEEGKGDFQIIKFKLTGVENGIYQIKEGDLEQNDLDSRDKIASVSYVDVKDWRDNIIVFSKSGFVEIVCSPKTIEDWKAGEDAIFRISAGFPESIEGYVNTIECQSGSTDGTTCMCKMYDGTIKTCESEITNHDCCEDEFGNKDTERTALVEINIDSLQCHYLCSATTWQLDEMYCKGEMAP